MRPNKSLERTVANWGRTVRASAVGARAGVEVRRWPAVQTQSLERIPVDRRSNWIEPFGLFRCPRCGHFQRHASLLMRTWHTYNWCGECKSYFRLKNAYAYIILWGVACAAIGWLVIWWYVRFFLDAIPCVGRVAYNVRNCVVNGRRHMGFIVAQTVSRIMFRIRVGLEDAP
jgi:hypothetical protein